MRRTARRPALLAAAALLAALAACGGTSDSAQSPSPAPGSTSAASGTTPPPTPPTAPPDRGPVDDSPPQRARQSQIPAAGLPGLNQGWTWTRESSGAGPGDRPPSVCLQASLTAIGATAEYRTDFSSPLDQQSSAVQLTAVFPDEKTAEASSGVLTAWQQQCKSHATRELGLDDVRVGDSHAVATVVGDGQQSMLTYRPVPRHRDLAWFQAEGFVRDGDTVSYLVITTAGQDYNYEPGEEPMDRALVVAGRMLIESR